MPDIRELIPVPAYIDACAAACRYDLLYGPSYALVPSAGIESFTDDDLATYPDDLDASAGTITETYTGPIGDALRAFIDGLPSEIWEDVFAGEFLTSEPEAWEDEETGEWIEPEWSDYRHLDSSAIVEALFGRTIAKEFK